MSPRRPRPAPDLTGPQQEALDAIRAACQDVHTAADALDAARTRRTLVLREHRELVDELGPRLLSRMLEQSLGEAAIRMALR